MRIVVLLAAATVAFAQADDPAYQPLSQAYEALRARDYDTAIDNFRKAIEAAPQRAAIRKDLAYTYLRIGENVLARDEFQEAMQIDPTDTQVAMEYAFLCNETKKVAQARRIFDRIRKSGDAAFAPTAEKAFQNIDAPLAEGIARWKKAIELGADNFSAHFELATLAEERDELALAAEHYEKAWRILPDRRSVLVDWGRVLKAGGREADADAVLVAAWFGGETRAAEMARELFPERFPYVSEFRRALELDPKNVELRRELAYLLLQMGRGEEAEQEFRILAENPPGDLLSMTQLGFLLYARGDRQNAMPLFHRVLAGPDEDLANRVRAVLRVLQVDSQPAAESAKAMAERSIKAGYLKDALEYLQAAHAADPNDYDVMYKLGWTNNILHQDLEAFHWFAAARRSPDPEIAGRASRAWKNLRPAEERVRITAWFNPVISTRWDDAFGYAQVKAEVRTDTPLVPYVSFRFVGDTRRTLGTTPGVIPQYLSESSLIPGIGVRTQYWHGIMGWFETGMAMGYLTGHFLPDYRGGVSAARGIGSQLSGEAPGLFADTTLDGIFVSRFGKDFLVYSQSHAGYSLGPPDLRAQIYWNANLTFDNQRQTWANFVETGPGIRFRTAAMPSNMFLTVNSLRGEYLLSQGGVRRTTFNDLRIGMWYAFTR
jgi:Tfp pilus assembly protein PilF